MNSSVILFSSPSSDTSTSFRGGAVFGSCFAMGDDSCSSAASDSRVSTLAGRKNVLRRARTPGVATGFLCSGGLSPTRFYSDIALFCFATKGAGLSVESDSDLKLSPSSCSSGAIAYSSWIVARRLTPPVACGLGTSKLFMSDLFSSTTGRRQGALACLCARGTV